MMPLFWYLVEGEGRDLDGIKGCFGFFVNCVVQAASKESGEALIHSCLAQDDLSVTAIKDADHLENLAWSDEEADREIAELTREATEAQGQPCFGAFHTWIK